MDEPTAGMAPRERIELMRLTAQIAREQSIGVLFTEHDMDVVFEHADRILVLNRGSLIAEGTPAEVRAQPARCARSISARAWSTTPATARERRHEAQRSRISTAITAPRTSCSTSRSRSATARSWRCSAATAPASRRRFARSSVWSSSARAASCSRAGTSRASRRMRSCAAASATCRRSGASSPISRWRRISKSAASRSAAECAALDARKAVRAVSQSWRDAQPPGRPHERRRAADADDCAHA